MHYIIIHLLKSHHIYPSLIFVIVHFRHANFNMTVSLSRGTSDDFGEDLEFDLEKWWQWRQLRSKWAQVKSQEPVLREADWNLNPLSRN